MRILLVHRYYWPDVPTHAQSLRFIGEHLASEGHEASVFCGPPTYNDAYDGPPRPEHEVVNGVEIHRVSLPTDSKKRPVLRAISMVIFALRLSGHVMRRRSEYDLVAVTTIPPILMGLAAQIMNLIPGVPFIYHCVDLHPESAELAGVVRSRLVSRLARRIDARSCSSAAAVVVLSEDMRDTIARRGISTSNVHVLNNFDIEDTTTPVGGSPLPKEPGHFRFLFAGNMGRFQGLDRLIDAAHSIAEEYPEMELVFMGAGTCVEDLKRQAGSLLGGAIKFVPHQPLEIALGAMGEADMAVVSLQPLIYQVAYPSKTMMYLKAGCRLLVVVEPESKIAQFVENEGLGITCAPNDVDALEMALRKSLALGPASATDRDRAQRACEEFFGRQALLAKWTTLVGNLRGTTR